MKTCRDLGPLLALWIALTGSLSSADARGPASLSEGAVPIAEAVARARAQHRALVIEVSTSWCAACKELETEVLPRPAVQRALGGVLFARYDAEAGLGVAAAKTLKIVGYPTTLALAEDGGEISRIQGVPDSADFVRWLQRVAGESSALKDLEERARSHPEDGRSLLVLARRYRRMGQTEQARTMTARALQAAQGHDESVAAAADWALRIDQVKAALRDEPRRAMVAHLTQYPSGPMADQALVALSRLGPADEATRKALGRYLTAHEVAGEEERLNQAIYACLRVEATAEAEQGARWLISGSGAGNPLFLDTLAEVLHLRGDSAAALQMSERALAYVPSTSTDDTRGELLKNQQRYRRGRKEPPAELLREDDSLFPWEQ